VAARALPFAIGGNHDLDPLAAECPHRPSALGNPTSAQEWWVQVRTRRNVKPTGVHGSHSPGAEVQCPNGEACVACVGACVANRGGAVGRWRGDVADDVDARAPAFLPAGHDVLVGAVPRLAVPVAYASRRAVVGGERRVRAGCRRLGLVAVATADYRNARGGLTESSSYSRFRIGSVCPARWAFGACRPRAGGGGARRGPGRDRAGATRGIQVGR
jgi:hypothetical protein